MWWEFLDFYKSCWALLCYLETVWSFQVLLLWLARWVWCSAHARANYSPLLRQDFPEYPTQCIIKYELLWWGGMGTIPSPVCQALFLCFFHIILTLASSYAFSYQYSAEQLRRPTKNLWGSFSEQQSSLMFYPTDLSCSSLPGLWAPSPQLRKSSGLYFSTTAWGLS